MTLEFSVSTGITTPIYQQIIDQVKLAIAKGELKEGDKLQSVRELAGYLVVNPNTVAKAYRELVREGVLESRHGAGVFVAEKTQVLKRSERLRRLDKALDNLISEIVLLDLSEEEIVQALKEKYSELDKGDKND